MKRSQEHWLWLSPSLWLVLSLAVVFIGSVLFLMVRSTRTQAEVRLRVTAISSSAMMGQTLRAAQDTVEQTIWQSNAQLRERWQGHLAMYDKQRTTLMKALGRAQRASWGHFTREVSIRLSSIMADVSRARRSRFVGPLSFRATFRKCMQKHKTLVRQLRRELGLLSVRLADYWSWMSYLALIACFFAILVVVFFARDRRLRNEAERLKDEFVSNVSHELRTPLTAFRGAISLLKHQSEEALIKQSEQLLDIAERNALHLNVLIDDLLDFQKLQAGQLALEMESCEVNALLQECIESNQPFAEEAGISLVLERLQAPVWMELDPARFRQIIDNLLSNAIKFSPRGESVYIRACLCQKEKGIRIEVEDKGPGISEDDQRLIFQRFKQLRGSSDRSKHKQKGTGLGLNICQMLVECMGGEIGVNSQLGQGSAFFVVLERPVSSKASS